MDEIVWSLSACIWDEVDLSEAFSCGAAEGLVSTSMRLMNDSSCLDEFITTMIICAGTAYLSLSGRQLSTITLIIVPIAICVCVCVCACRDNVRDYYSQITYTISTEWIMLTMLRDSREVVGI